jgi:gliding motility-associated-like protein
MFQIYSFKNFFVLVCLIFLYNQSIAQNKVVDGSFESNTPFTDPAEITQKFRTYRAPNIMGAWMVEKDSIDKNHRTLLALGNAPGGGDHYIDLKDSGIINQDINGLIVGKKYVFTFFISTHETYFNDCITSGKGDFKLKVTLGDVVNETIKGVNPAWIKMKYTFTANSTSALLQFESNSNCSADGGFLLDLVSIIAEEDIIPCDQKPRFLTASEDITQCLQRGSLTNLTLTASGATSYEWTPAAAFSDAKAATTVASISNSSRLIVKGTDEDGCVNYDTVLVTINFNPTLSFNPDPLEGCYLDTKEVEVTGASSYQWSPTTGLSSPTSSNPTVRFMHGVTQYEVEGTDGFGCKSKDTLKVRVFTLPVLETIRDTIVCEGDQLKLWVKGARIYEWTPSDAMINANTSEPIINIMERTIFNVKGTDSNGCNNMKMVVINVAPKPKLTASRVDFVTGCDSVYIHLLAEGADKYEWSPAKYCNDSTSNNPYVRVPYDVDFVVKGTSWQGCLAYDTVKVNMYETSRIYIPNAFTPNNDNVNDYFKSSKYCNFEELEMSVFNRWGQRVYNSNDPMRGWDGKVNGGQDAPMDVYFYFIKGVNSAREERMFKGEVTLIR